MPVAEILNSDVKSREKKVVNLTSTLRTTLSTFLEWLLTPELMKDKGNGESACASYVFSFVHGVLRPLMMTVTCNRGKDKIRLGEINLILIYKQYFFFKEV